MGQPGEKNITAFIEPKVAEAFHLQCDENIYKKYAAIAGAIRLWLILPQEHQMTLMKNGADATKVLKDILRSTAQASYKAPKSAKQRKEKMKILLREIQALLEGPSDRPKTKTPP